MGKHVNKRLTKYDYSQSTYGRWTVLSKDVLPGRRWLCACSCGQRSNVLISGLVGGESRSCGCIRFEGASNRTHGSSTTHEYYVWHNMKVRCRDASGKSYAHYGGRGIRVCASWVDSFSSFLADMGRRPSPKHSLERIDNDGPYSPENCKWATKLEQARNKRSVRRVTINGTTKSLVEWASERGLSYDAVYQRIHLLHWEPEVALSVPVRVMRRI